MRDIFYLRSASNCAPAALHFAKRLTNIHTFILKRLMVRYIYIENNGKMCKGLKLNMTFFTPLTLIYRITSFIFVIAWLAAQF